MTVTSVSIASPPVVKFTVADGFGNPVVGLGNTSQEPPRPSAATYPNLAFAIAKLVPGTNGSPSKWVSYIVTTVPTKTRRLEPSPLSAQRPNTDNTGTLVDNGDGRYTYTFCRDITTMASQVAAI